MSSQSSSPAKEASGGARKDAYLNFTRKLAHSEKKERDRAVRFVAKWLAHQPNASETDLRKLWQGLFFCLWHADKLLVQAEVAANLANLLHSSGTVEGGMRYLGAGLWTIQQRWQTVDKYRVDKFLSLLRHLLRQALLLLARHQWRAEDIALFAHPLKSYPFGSLASTDSTLALPLCPGIALHFADIFLAELKLAMETNVDGNGNLTLRKGVVNDLLEPFLYAMARYPDKLVISRIEGRIVGPLMQMPSADKELPATSPRRFIDFPALSARFFEYATSKDTKDSHRGRLYRYKKAIQKQFNPAPGVAPMEVQESINGVTTTEENGKEAEAEEEHEEENGAEEGEKEEAEAEAEAADEGEEEEKGEEEAEDDQTDHIPMTKKRKAGLLGVLGARRSPQRSWAQAYRKKARRSRSSLLGLNGSYEDYEPVVANGTGTGAKEEEGVEVERRTPTASPVGSPGKRSNRVRFSLERNMSQEFRKVDPPAKHSRGSTPPPSRQPAFSILKSPLKTAHSPAVRK